MYTTPRKVKQESRLRRSLSLTNSNNNNGRPSNNPVNGSEAFGDEQTTSFSTNHSRPPQSHYHLNGIAESSFPADPFLSQSIPIEQQNGNSRNRFSYTNSSGAVIIPDVIDVSQPDGSSLDFQQHYHLPPSSLYEQSAPPPYRNPPRTGAPTTLSDHQQHNGGAHSQSFTTSAPISPQSVPDSPVDSFHTHSAKFPIVKEVIISEREIQSGHLGAFGNTPQRSISAGTLPRVVPTSSSSSSVPPTLPQSQQIPTSSTSLLTPEYIKKFQNKKLTKHLAWKDERRALTLDSETAKELQNQLAAAAAKQKSSEAQGTGTIRRSGSAFELQKLIEAFNEEQHALVMSSLQQGLVPSKRGLDGIDNPALDIGFQNNSSSNGHPHNLGSSGSSSNPYVGNHPGKMAGYTFSDSSASQSLSLSSSNTDSLDTVIYKGPNAPATSVRDWQRSKESMQTDFGHRNDGNSMGIRGDSQGIFDSRSYPMQQQASSSPYQPMQFNGPGGSGSGQTPSSSSTTNNGYSMEYRHQQQVQQQNLSVQSVHQAQPVAHHHHSQQQNGGMRQPNGASSAASQLQYNASASPMLPTKSPMVTHKPLLPPPGPSPSSSSNQSVPSVGGSSNIKSNLNGGVSGNSGGGGGGDNSSSVGLDKAKDSTKMFPTKTYNHIKDMISSRFGNNNSAASSASGMPQKSLNNSAAAVNSNSSNSNGTSNGNFSMNGQNGMNSYMDSSSPASSMGMPSLPSYGHNHGHIHGHMHDSYGSAPYYTSPPAVSPPGNNGANSSGNQPMMNGANSYRSPPMNDRKNVNTSFRKAIHQSTMKSNLTEESLQLRPIMESTNMNGSNRDLYRSMQYTQQNGDQNQQQQQQQQQQRYGLGHEPPSPSLVPHHVERAQRALDKLCEPSGAQFHRTGSGPMTHQNGISRMVQQFSSGNNEENNRAMYPNGYNGGGQDKGKIGATSSGSGASQLTTGGELGAIPRNRFSVTPGPSSSTSNSSGGMGAGSATAQNGGLSIESSLSSPSSSYTHSSSKHHAPTTSLPNGSNTGSSSNNNKSGGNSANNNDQPPPLPTSQKPEVSGASGHSSSGLSHHHLHHLHSHNTLGLPPVLPSVLAGEKRENGDGSSGTMETPSSGTIHLESAQGATGAGAGGNASSSALALNKSKSEQLKKITSDLHNLAISVAAEQHFHNHHLQFASGSGSNNNQSSSSECENKGSQRIGSGQSHTTSDSGVGTVMLTKSPLNSISDQENKIGGDLLGGENQKFGDNVMDSVSSGNDSEWVDIVEPEIRQILELEKKAKPGKSLRPGEKMTGVPSALVTSTPAHIITQGHLGKVNQMANGNANSHAKNGEQPDLMGDITASPIPHHRLMSGSPSQSPKIPKKFDLNSYNKKASQNRSQELLAGPSGTSSAQNGSGPSTSKVKSPRSTTKVSRSNSGAGQQRWNGRSSRGDKGSKNAAAHRLIKDLGLKGIKLSRHAASQILYPHDDNGDMTSTTTGLDLESMLDGQTEQTSDDDDDMSTTIDTTDAHAIRRQLESLESMYTEVLKVLGAKRFSGNRYPPNDLRNAKRRPYGSMSSLPSSVSSRPFRERKLKLDDKKKVKDIKSINKRFQRLESHVVTLARSVAHLSSEMRTQHMMVQEIESIRNEMQQLRNQVLKSSMQNQSAAAAAAQNFARVSSGRNGAGVNLVSTTDWTSFRNALPSLTNPCRVRKLTKFFGDEPPLVRIFLKKLGYEKYASAFEQERIGIMELPYLTEERLNKMGIPMGPRLRILQEAQLCLKPGYHQHHESHHTHHQSNNHGPGNLSVYVV